MLKTMMHEIREFRKGEVAGFDRDSQISALAKLQSEAKTARTPNLVASDPQINSMNDIASGAVPVVQEDADSSRKSTTDLEVDTEYEQEVERFQGVIKDWREERKNRPKIRKSIHEDYQRAAQAQFRPDLQKEKRLQEFASSHHKKYAQSDMNRTHSDVFAGFNPNFALTGQNNLFGQPASR